MQKMEIHRCNLECILFSVMISFVLGTTYPFEVFAVACKVCLIMAVVVLVLALLLPFKFEFSRLYLRIFTPWGMRWTIKVSRLVFIHYQRGVFEGYEVRLRDTGKVVFRTWGSNESEDLEEIIGVFRYKIYEN